MGLRLVLKRKKTSNNRTKTNIVAEYDFGGRVKKQNPSTFGVLFMSQCHKKTRSQTQKQVKELHKEVVVIVASKTTRQISRESVVATVVPEEIADTESTVTKVLPEAIVDFPTKDVVDTASLPSLQDADSHDVQQTPRVLEDDGIGEKATLNCHGTEWWDEECNTELNGPIPVWT